MTKEVSRKPEQLSGYTPDKDDPMVETGPAIRTKGVSAEESRGRRAPKKGSGAVIGSGAGAGGGGAPEDFDDDPAGGGGTPLKNP